MKLLLLTTILLSGKVKEDTKPIRPRIIYSKPRFRKCVKAVDFEYRVKRDTKVYK